MNVQAIEGDDTAYGQALFPVPAEDPNDPLQASNPVNMAAVAWTDMFPVAGVEEGRRAHYLFNLFLPL